MLLSHFSRVRLCATPKIATHQAPPSLGFFTQEHWSGLPFPSPMHESEKWKWSRSVVSDPQRPHRLQASRLLRPWDFPGKSTGMGCHCLLCFLTLKTMFSLLHYTIKFCHASILSFIHPTNLHWEAFSMSSLLVGHRVREKRYGPCF